MSTTTTCLSTIETVKFQTPLTIDGTERSESGTPDITVNNYDDDMLAIPKRNMLNSKRGLEIDSKYERET